MQGLPVTPIRCISVICTEGDFEAPLSDQILGKLHVAQG